jgi:DnaJ family protein A protein 5
MKEHGIVDSALFHSRYDDHREQILSDNQAPSSEISADELFRYFTTSCYTDYSDAPNGFFSVYRELYSRISSEKLTFGTSTNTYTDIKAFYDFFMNFTTSNTFAWADKYDLRQAPDRRVRRLMEKDNKKSRDAKKKEFVDAVRNLTEFIRKRDPRYKAFTELQKKETKHEKPVQKKKEKTVHKEFVEQDWMKVAYSDDEGESDEELEEEDDDLYCVACDKMFKTERQLENHFNSKKHIKNVEMLRLEMSDYDQEDDDDESINAENDQEVGNEDSAAEDDQEIVNENSAEYFTPEEAEEAQKSDDEIQVPNSNKQKKKKKKKNVMNIIEHDDIHLEELSISEQEPASVDIETPVEPEVDQLDQQAEQKKKPRRRKEKGKDKGETFKCNICGKNFETRNKMFGHIKETGHALRK